MYVCHVYVYINKYNYAYLIRRDRVHNSAKQYMQYSSLLLFLLLFLLSILLP